jgi:hypothetical protein
MDAIYWGMFYVVLALMVVFALAYAVSRYQKVSYEAALQTVHDKLCAIRGADPKTATLTDTVAWIRDELEEHMDPFIKDKIGDRK